jgi:CBS domain-containing protein
MKVREMMTEDVRCCRPQTNLAVAAQLMTENDCGVLPVLGDDGGVVGVITDRDICIVLSTAMRRASEIAVSEAMSIEVYSCSPEDHVKVALNQMARAQVRRLPVIDRAGDLQGIVSISDVMACYWRSARAEAPSISCHDIVEAYGRICEPGHEQNRHRRLGRVAGA